MYDNNCKQMELDGKTITGFKTQSFSKQMGPLYPLSITTFISSYGPYINENIKTISQLDLIVMLRNYPVDKQITMSPTGS